LLLEPKKRSVSQTEDYGRDGFALKPSKLNDPGNPAG
jgi:hypothetical protein